METIGKVFGVFGFRDFGGAFLGLGIGSEGSSEIGIRV